MAAYSLLNPYSIRAINMGLFAQLLLGATKITLERKNNVMKKGKMLREKFAIDVINSQYFRDSILL